MRSLLALCIPSLALAAPRLETIDRGDVVEVIAHDVTAATTAITPVRSRLEVPLATRISPIKAASADPTVVVTELAKELSIKLPFDRAEVKALAAHARAVQIDGDLHVLIPRKLPAAGTAITLPEPTVSEPTEAPPHPLAPPVEVVRPTADPAASTQPASPVLQAPPPAVQAAPPSRPIATAQPAPNPLTKPSTLGVLALVMLGCGVWVMRRRKRTQATDATIDVIAQRQLGAKAKVVWLAVGAREMIVSVTPQAVRVLAQWQKPAAAQQVELPQAQVVTPRTITQQPTKSTDGTRALDDRSSPAIAGLLKLRAKTVPPPDVGPLADEIASGDVEADAAWAKEILLATRSARGTR